jgi:uncharacterized damage-inducible protein DinB
MNFSLEKSLEILERTPDTVSIMLNNLSDEWTTKNEGDGTWSVYDIVGHLIHGEKTDWIPRTEIILSSKPVKTFEPFDRFAQFQESQGKSLGKLLEEFKQLRKKNINTLRSKNISPQHLEQKGIHPAFGEVTLSQLLATWVAHDLNHIAQIARVMAKQYRQDVGPWIQYLGILNK